MASSRWKRFAFFDRQNLNVPNDVMDDLFPSELSGGTVSMRQQARASSLSGAEDVVSMVVSTASLPTQISPLSPKHTADDGVQSSAQDEEDPLTAMWSSLTACTVPRTLDSTDILLPSQAQLPRGASSAGVSDSPSALQRHEGLVLLFVASKQTELIHCLDLTVRCSAPMSKGDPTDKSMEDMDGWRGYLAAPAPTPATATESDAPRTVTALAVSRTKQGTLHLCGITSQQHLWVWEDPHLSLSCRRPLTTPKGMPGDAKIGIVTCPTSDGALTAIDAQPGVVAVGTDKGAVLLYAYPSHQVKPLKVYLKIPPPPAEALQVVSLQLSVEESKATVFVAYRPVDDMGSSGANESNNAGARSTVGLCCYELPLPPTTIGSLASPLARHDLDGRHVMRTTLVDSLTVPSQQITVARPDGLYSYSSTERTGVAPIDGQKLAMCLVPPTIPKETARTVDWDQVGAGYALVASRDNKSGRDAVDIYDVTNKLVALHLLLSPGHGALRAVGLSSHAAQRSLAIVLTSGGSILTLTEKDTSEKISLLTQKSLYAAAIVVAYSDPSMESMDITMLYRRYAEHLYRKGDFAGAMEQYMYTIGSLESSHVIFRYLDAPKIPLLVNYLERLRSRELATPVHNELLRTCYLKLNDTDAADAIASSATSIDKSSLNSVIANLGHNPKEALATICTLDATQAAEVLVIHGASLARVLPREVAGIVISLCVGTYSPKALAAAALTAEDPTNLNHMIQYATDDRDKACTPYPVSLFASAFIEHPKLLRLILAHCNRNKCTLTQSLRRSLLELTLSEWNQAKRSGDTEAEKLRHKEAIAALTDSHCRDIGDYDALVICQLAGFSEGELLLYERLQMGSMLLERYAKDGSEKSRRQMLAMCQSDPEMLAEVLATFVTIAAKKLKEHANLDDMSENDETEEILEDIQEALTLARRQGVLPPVRIARILAGEGPGQFSPADISDTAPKRHTIPLSVALEYVGTILEDSRQEITRLNEEVEEYSQLCSTMEDEIKNLLKSSSGSSAFQGAASEPDRSDFAQHVNIDELYTKAKTEDLDVLGTTTTEQSSEAFWRDMNQSENSFETIARYFAKQVIK